MILPFSQVSSRYTTIKLFKKKTFKKAGSTDDINRLDFSFSHNMPTYSGMVSDT